jgi:Uma2 family endonuclease
MQPQLTGGGSLRTPMRYEDYVALGETKHTEYYDGICVVNPPNRRHVVAAKRIVRLLDDHCPDGLTTYPEWGWILEAGVELRPDAMVASTDAPGDDQLRVAPLLVVEILSPTTRDADLHRKKELYAHGGAEWYWTVDLDIPELVLHRNEGGDLAAVQGVNRDGGTTIGPFAVPIDLDALLA